MQDHRRGNGHDEIGNIKGEGDKIGFKIVFFTGDFKEGDQYRVEPGNEAENEEKDANNRDREDVIPFGVAGQR